MRAHKSGKISLTIKNRTYGHWGAFYTKLFASHHHFSHRIWNSCIGRLIEEYIQKYRPLTLRIWQA